MGNIRSRIMQSFKKCGMYILGTVRLYFQIYERVGTYTTRNWLWYFRQNLLYIVSPHINKWFFVRINVDRALCKVSEDSWHLLYCWHKRGRRAELISLPRCLLFTIHDLKSGRGVYLLYHAAQTNVKRCAAQAGLPSDYILN